MNTAQKVVWSLWFAAVTIIFVVVSFMPGGFANAMAGALLYGVFLLVPTTIVLWIWQDKK